MLFILKFSTSYIYTRVSQTENWTTLSCSILPWFIMGLEVLGKTVHFFILCCNKKLIQNSYYLIFDPSQVKILVTVIELLSPEHCQTHILSNLLTTLPHFQTLQSFSFLRSTFVFTIQQKTVLELFSHFQTTHLKLNILELPPVYFL